MTRLPRQLLCRRAIYPTMLMLLLFGSALTSGWGQTSTAPPSPACRVTDGDTIRCGSERIRLLGIDAPELPGHCRTGRHCAPGDPVASASSLATLLASGSPSIQRVGIDRYGRTLATVSVDGQDLSCWQLANGQAIYRRDWDRGGQVKARCASAAIRATAPR